MLSLVLPKGSLERATLDLFDAADLVDQGSKAVQVHRRVVVDGNAQEVPKLFDQGG